MNRKTLISLACLVCLAASLSGCATGPGPTHSWQAAASVPRYHADNRDCLPAHEARKEFAAGSEEFVAYKACMQGRGYELIALR